MLAENIVIVFRIDVSMLPRQGGGYIQCLSDMESPVFGGTYTWIVLSDCVVSRNKFRNLGTGIHSDVLGSCSMEHAGIVLSDCAVNPNGFNVFFWQLSTFVFVGTLTWLMHH